MGKPTSLRSANSLSTTDNNCAAHTRGVMVHTSHGLVRIQYNGERTAQMLNDVNTYDCKWAKLRCGRAFNLRSYNKINVQSCSPLGIRVFHTACRVFFFSCNAGNALPPPGFFFFKYHSTSTTHTFLIHTIHSASCFFATNLCRIASHKI